MAVVKLKGDERIDQLYSQDIKIIQSPSVFSFSLDAVMLANFAEPKISKNSFLVDLCAGNGAVGLFLSHKTHGKIAEVEIQPRLSDMANRSVQLNGLEDQVTVYNDDLSQASQIFGKDSVDVVTVNPPYFSNLSTSKKNPNEYLAIARHEIKTNLRSVIQTSSDLLKTGGKLYMVYRPDRLHELMNVMTHFRLAMKRIQFIYPKVDRKSNMMLVSAIKDGKETGLNVDYPITVYHQNGEYSKEVKKMLYGE
ncbi:tRNA1(Val) (adenine(37)-N6)-methyltransferase [Fructilactobacillus fructivorans]|uniref:Methyltransferase n=1 Tax=Fructilactobacillus fructivorans TaxID=1614 RepID=A0AAE6P1Y0_9LACO|nr:tRNA1(Val) (adenine(37)-N6)-methyltransferase [Fructilactobacillus fructivorans]QFX92750.1 methyltransferase [Fructilactobacillus fructivorans]RDV65657.1 tRNA1(Val) (adenine(37)-N6)-methyltransferase [Fructilactobacillus fructivorans]